jgi:hypothetical protein
MTTRPIAMYAEPMEMFARPISMHPQIMIDTNSICLMQLGKRTQQAREDLAEAIDR